MSNFVDLLKEAVSKLVSIFRKDEPHGPVRVKNGLGNFLIQKGIITQEQLQKALEFQSRNTGKKIGEVLAEIDILGEEEVLKELASYLGIEYVTLENATYPLAHQNIFRKKTMLEHCFAPFDLSGNFLSIAITDINNFELRNMIESSLTKSKINYHVTYYLSMPSMIYTFIHNSYTRHPYYPNILGKNKKFGEYLVEKQILTKEQIDEVIRHQKQFMHKRIGELICELNILDRGLTLKELAQHENTEYESLDDRNVDSELIKLFNIRFMIENRFVPFEKENNTVKIAINNIFDDELIETIQKDLREKGLEAKLYLSFSDSILEFLKQAEPVA